MLATHHRDFINQLRVLLVFIEFNILICILIGRQKRTHLNPTPPPATAPAPASPQEENRATKPLDNVLDPSKTRQGMLQQSPDGTRWKVPHAVGANRWEAYHHEEAHENRQ